MALAHTRAAALVSAVIGSAAFVAEMISNDSVLFTKCAAQVNIDGGRSNLPGMKRDMFSSMGRGGAGVPGAGGGKKQKDCPPGDGKSLFTSLAFVSGQMYVRTADEPECVPLESIGGYNVTSLVAAAKQCGPVGEYKQRIATNLSQVLWAAGLEDWPTEDDQTVEVRLFNVTEPIQLSPTEEKGTTIKDCWAYSCKCKQASSPIARALLTTILSILAVGLLVDSVQQWQEIRVMEKEEAEAAEKKKDGDGDDADGDKKKEDGKEDGDDKKEKKEKKDKKDKKEKKDKEVVEADDDEDEDAEKKKKKKKDKKDKKEKKEKKKKKADAAEDDDEDDDDEGEA